MLMWKSKSEWESVQMWVGDGGKGQCEEAKWDGNGWEQTVYFRNIPLGADI